MLEVKHISKTYRPKKGHPVKAIDDVSIRFPEKGLIFILGKSGSGKSTLLNVLGGLDKVDSGEIIIKGKSSKDFSQADFDSYRNTYLGFIFQEYNILNEFTVGENIGLALQLQGKKATPEEVDAILKQVDLVGFSKRKPNELSGGQKQRIAIARALIKKPEIILADEPTGALDSKTGLQVFDTLKELSREKLVIVVSHDREFAEMYGDRVIEMKDGKVISDIEKFREKPQQTDSGLVEIDTHMLALKKGHVLTKEDIDALNKVLQESDTLISADNNVNKEFRRIARIDDNLNRETFKDTDENAIVYKKDEKFSLIKSSLPIPRAFKIGASALKSKPVRLFFTILLSVCAFGLFGIVDTIGTYDTSKTVYDGLQNRTSNLFSVQKEVKSEDYDWYSQDNSISQEEADEFDKRLGVTTDKAFTQNYMNINFYLNNPKNYTFFTGQTPGFVYLSNDRMESLGFEMMYGDYPTKIDEIALTDYQLCGFEHLGFSSWNSYGEDTQIKPQDIKPEELIGKKINLDSDTFTITGFIKTGFNFEEYEDLYESDNYYNDTNLRNLNSQLEKQVNLSYPNAFYVSKAMADNYLANKGFVSSRKLDNANLSASFEDPLYIYAESLTSVDNAPVAIDFFEDGKTSLNDKEIIVSSSYLSNMFSIDDAEVDDEDRMQKSYSLNGVYDDTTDEQIGWKLDEYENEITYVYQINSFSYIFDYALDNLPNSNEFNQFVEEYYQIQTYDYETETSTWSPCKTEITDTLKAYAYADAIQNPYSIYEDYNEKYSQEMQDFFEDYAQNQYAATSNPFGGKTVDQLNSEFRDALNEKYLKPEPYEIDGRLGILDYSQGSVSDPTLETYTIVGTFDDPQGRNSNAIIVWDDFYDEFVSHIKTGYSYLLLDVPDNATLEKLVKETYSTDTIRYHLNNAVSESISSFDSMIHMMSEIFLYVGIGLAVFSGLLLMNFISASITYKKREIGILRAVGAKSSDVFKIFFSEAFVIAIINFVIACVGAGIGAYFFNGAIVDAIGSMGSFFIFGIRQICLMLALSIGIAFLASFLPVYLIAKKRPVEAIRSV